MFFNRENQESGDHLVGDVNKVLKVVIVVVGFLALLNLLVIPLFQKVQNLYQAWGGY